VMREIKFRGKSMTQASRFKNGFAKGSLLIDLDKNGEKVYSIVLLDPYTTPPTCSQMPPNPVQYVKPETVGQFTGLTDNSEEKEEIYGGDILRAMNGDNFIVEYLTDWGAYKIYRPDGSNTRCLNDLRVDIIELFELRIVGNITDNPELLDVKNE